LNAATTSLATTLQLHLFFTLHYPTCYFRVCTIIAFVSICISSTLPTSMESGNPPPSAPSASRGSNQRGRDRARERARTRARGGPHAGQRGDGQEGQILPAIENVPPDGTGNPRGRGGRRGGNRGRGSRGAAQQSNHANHQAFLETLPRAPSGPAAESATNGSKPPRVENQPDQARGRGRESSHGRRMHRNVIVRTVGNRTFGVGPPSVFQLRGR
jgi:hypothetical protein